MKKRALILAVAVLGIGTVVALVAIQGQLTAAPNPLTQYALNQGQRYSLEGSLSQVLDAGSYRYLELKPDGAEAVWIATLRGAPLEGRVSAQVIARADRFESKRLGRTFSPLLFAIVRNAPITSEKKTP
jgi:hypothetical protein